MSDSTGTAPPTGNAAGAETPVADTPARRAFDRGDFAEVRRLLRDAPPGAGGSGDEALRRATSVDPLHAVVLALCLLAVVAIVVHYGL